MSAMNIAQETLPTQGSLHHSLFVALKEKYDFLPSVEEMVADTDLTCHLAKTPSKKKSPPAEDRRGVYNEMKCDARVWKEKPKSGGLGYDDIQCHAKKVDGCDGLCKKHFNFLTDGKLWLGRVTEKRPENPVHPTAGEKAWCTDEDGNEVVKEKKARKSPPSTGKKARKPRKNKSVEEIKESLKIEELRELLRKAEAEEEKSIKDEEEEDEDEENETITFEGVEYQHNKEDHTVLKMETFEEVGKWNTTTGRIDFNEEDSE